MSSHSEHELPEAGPVGVRAPDEYDALADLFLGERPEGAAPDRGPYTFPRPDAGEWADREGEVRVEGLVVGHLPVLASAWISQYARHRRRELGCPVALVRVRGGHVQIDLHADEAPEECDTIGQAIRVANGAGAAWIVRVDEPDEPRLAEAGLDDLTLLTGANQAAIVGSYRVIKRLAGDGDEETGPSRVRLAAMGSKEEDAERIGDKISRAASTFLGREVEVAAVIDRIEPGRATTIYAGELEWTVEHLIDRLRAESTPLPAEEPAGAVEPPAPGVERREPKPVAPVHPAPRPAPPRRPGPSSAPPARRPLSAHVDGLVGVPAACPYADGVELARDMTGRLHLLARSGPGSVERLLTARRWASAHASLLGAAHGPLEAADAALHLVTSDAASVRGLLDTEIRVHLLAPVEVEGRRGWFCTALN
jgi:hypothetical protein